LEQSYNSFYLYIIIKAGIFTSMLDQCENLTFDSPKANKRCFQKFLYYEGQHDAVGGRGRDNHIFAKLRFNLGLANMQETATMYSFNFFFLWLKITKMILGIGVVATLSKLRDYSHKINESHLLSTICTALHLRFETLLKVLFISLAILSVYWEEQICCTGNFSFEHFLLFFKLLQDCDVCVWCGGKTCSFLFETAFWNWPRPF